MAKNSTAAHSGMPILTIVRKEENEHKNAKLIDLKKVDNKPKILLPPPQEQYIKAKKHDFL